MGEAHFYGGQAVLEGVMMRGRDVYATAVRRRDGSVVVEKRAVPHFLQGSRWVRLPFIRGTFMLVEALTLGLRSLQFSANVALEDEIEAEAEAPPEPAVPRRRPWVAAAVLALAGAGASWLVAPRLAPWVASRLPGLASRVGAHAALEPSEALWITRIGLAAVVACVLLLALGRSPRAAHATQAESLSDTTLWLTMLPALAMGVGLFVLLPTYLAGLVKLGDDYGAALLKNLLEGVIRLALILGYVASISLIGQVRRVFQYHGAEHKTINGLELEGRADPETAARQSPLHPRCGTAFLLLFIVLKIIVGCFFGWPVGWVRVALRLAMVPVVAALAYETTRYAGRSRDSWLSKVMSGPGLLLQRMTTREPEPGMIGVALYALAAVAPEVLLPAGWAAAAEFVPRRTTQAEAAAEEKRP